MNPTYSFQEMRDIIRKADSKPEFEAISLLIKQEGKRYTLVELQIIVTALQKALHNYVQKIIRGL